MDWNAFVKYLAAAALFSMLFALVLLHMLDATTFVALVCSALAGLGVHTSVTTPYPPPQVEATEVTANPVVLVRK